MVRDKDPGNDNDLYRSCGYEWQVAEDPEELGDNHVGKATIKIDSVEFQVG